MGEHPPAPILHAKLAADNTEPALRNYATKATLAASGATTISTCSPMAKLSAASSR